MPAISKFSRVFAVALRRTRAMEVSLFFNSIKGVHFERPQRSSYSKATKPGQELLLEALRVLDRSVIDVEFEFRAGTISRSKTAARPGTGIVHEAALAMKRTRLRPQGRDHYAGVSRVMSDLPTAILRRGD